MNSQHTKKKALKSQVSLRKAAISPFEKVMQEQFNTKSYRQKPQEPVKVIENADSGIVNHDPSNPPCASYRTTSREPTARNERGRSLNNRTHTNNLFRSNITISEQDKEDSRTQNARAQVESVYQL